MELLCRHVFCFIGLLLTFGVSQIACGTRSEQGSTDSIETKSESPRASQPAANIDKNAPDAKKFKVWGPGLTVDATLPARYFFVQARNFEGEDIKESLGDKAIDVNLKPFDGAGARAYLQVLDRNDGSYIVRFRMFRSLPQGVSIQITYKGKKVGDSPYQLKGPMYHETCNCPNPSLAAYSSALGCGASYGQIERDLSQFPEGFDMAEAVRIAVDRFTKNRGAHSVCHYTIVNNEVYRKCYGMHTDFKMFSDAIILSLTRKVSLPDVEFIVNLGDWPLVKPRDGPLIPIVSWCGSDDTADVILPTYDVMQAALETMGRVSLDMLSVQANTGPAWGDKSTRAFWRGRDSRQERIDLVKLARKRSDMIDAQLTNMFFFKHDEEMGPVGGRVGFFDFFKYKYQINVDGTVAAYRLPYLLAGDSLVMKQDSGYYEHFYRDLEPWQHYIPLKADLSDVIEQIEWARAHDQEAQEIAARAQQYARDNLQIADVFCYHVKFFEAYSRLMTSVPEVREGQEHVPQPADDNFPCACHTEGSKGKTEL